MLSGVDHLAERGIVDPGRVGVAGWSHGGFLAAWLVGRTDRFAAASVGAGISDWRAYYTGLQLPDDTDMYFKAALWEDPEIYDRSSPITYVQGAITPTLIRHGERDSTVPPGQARLFCRAFRDRGVEAKLIMDETGDPDETGSFGPRRTHRDNLERP